MSKGETCAAYVGAGPPKGTGLHRYIILGLCNTIICMYCGMQWTCDHVIISLCFLYNNYSLQAARARGLH